MKKVVAFSLLFVLVSLPLIAQESAGGINGTVRDETGGVIPGVEVSITNVATGAQVSTVSGDAGTYTFNSLRIGEYILTASMSGFKVSEQTGVRVVSGEVLSLDVELAVGEVTETVEVTGALATIEKTSNKAGYARVNEEIARLPLAVANSQRTAQSFLRTMPGVNFDPVGFGSNEGAAMQRSFIQGTPNSTASYSIDGIRASGSMHSALRDDNAPIPDLIQEFRLDTNTSAEHGWHSGVAVTLVFKSGTNDFHGNVFWYVRNDKLDARPWFAAERSVTRQNEYGFTLGGPIWKNRTFFFGGIDWYKLRSAAAGSVISVGTEKMRSGDFSELLGSQIGTDALGRPIFQGAIYDPLTTRPDGQGGFIRDQFPNNQIPSNRHSQISQQLISRTALPTQAGVTSNWVGGRASTPFDKKIFNWKVDHQIDPAGRHKITVGGDWGRLAHTSAYPLAFDESISSLHTNSQDQYRYRWNYYWTMRPDLLFNLRTGVARTPRLIGTKGQANDNTGAEIGIKGVNGPIAPQVGIQGLTGFGPIFRTLSDPSQTVPVHADVTWVKSSHNFKFGAAYLLSLSRVRIRRFTQGTYGFADVGTGLPGNPATGYGYASFLLGDVNTSQVRSGRAFKYDGAAFGFYFQDSWRVNPKLTVNYGIRNDVFVNQGESYDRIGAFNPTTPNPRAAGRPGAIWFWGEGQGRNGLKRVADTVFNNWGPRLGFAYAMDDKTVIRASGALMYAPLTGAMTSGFNTPNAGFAYRFHKNSLDVGVTPAYNWEDGFPDILPDLPSVDPAVENGNNVFNLNRDDFTPGKTVTVNFGLERDLGWGVAVRANYIGKFSHNLASQDAVRLNQLDPSLLSLGPLLGADINSPQAMDAGISLPYEGFTGPVSQALRAFPQFLDIAQRASPTTDLKYNSLQLAVQKRYGHGLSFLLGYTISKAIGNETFRQQGHSFAVSQHTSQRHLQHVFNNDRPQNVVLSWMYELPFGPGKRWGADTGSVAKNLIGGWTVGAIHNYFSGEPISVTSRVRYPGGFGAIWPDQVEGVPRLTGVSCGNYDPNDPSRNRYLNIDAFTNAQPFSFGDTRTLPATRLCSYFNENVTLQKDTYVSEDVYVRFGADFFNIFNRHIWANVNSDIGNTAGFGRYSAATGPRNIQVHIAIHF